MNFLLIIILILILEFIGAVQTPPLLLHLYLEKVLWLRDHLKTLEKIFWLKNCLRYKLLDTRRRISEFPAHRPMMNLTVIIPFAHLRQKEKGL